MSMRMTYSVPELFRLYIIFLLAVFLAKVVLILIVEEFCWKVHVMASKVSSIFLSD